MAKPHLLTNSIFRDLIDIAIPVGPTDLTCIPRTRFDAQVRESIACIVRAPTVALIAVLHSKVAILASCAIITTSRYCLDIVMSDLAA